MPEKFVKETAPCPALCSRAGIFCEAARGLGVQKTWPFPERKARLCAFTVPIKGTTRVLIAKGGQLTGKMGTILLIFF